MSYLGPYHEISMALDAYLRLLFGKVKLLNILIFLSL